MRKPIKENESLEAYIDRMVMWESNNHFIKDPQFDVIHWAVVYAPSKIVRLLLEQNPQLAQLKDNNNSNLLDILAANCSFYECNSTEAIADELDEIEKIIQILQEYGVDINAVNKHKLTPLFGVNDYRNAPFIKIWEKFIKHGAKINYANQHGSLLHRLIHPNYNELNIQAITFLLDHGIDVNIRCEWAMDGISGTALDVAQKAKARNKNEVIALLQLHGAGLPNPDNLPEGPTKRLVRNAIESSVYGNKFMRLQEDNAQLQETLHKAMALLSSQQQELSAMVRQREEITKLTLQEAENIVNTQRLSALMFSKQATLKTTIQESLNKHQITEEMIEIFIAQTAQEERYKILKDPVTLSLMLDPVMMADNKTIERSSAESWFKLGHTTSPIDHSPLKHNKLETNYFARQVIINFIEDNAAQIKEAYRQELRLDAAVKHKL